MCACVHNVHIQEYIGTCLYNISIKRFSSSSMKKKNGPYEGKVVGGQETSQVFSVIDQWPLCEEGVFSHNVLH